MRKNSTNSTNKPALLEQVEKISGIPTNYNSVEIHNLDLKQLIKKGLAPSVTDLDL